MNWDHWWEAKLKNPKPEELIDPLEIRYYSMLERMVLDEIGDVTEKKIVEVGCGSGVLSFRLAQKKANVFLVDDSKLALSYAKKIGAVTKSNAVFTESKAEKLPFKDNYFDVYHSMGLIEHYEEKKIFDILVESKRVVVPGGKIMIGVPNIANPEFFMGWLFGGRDENIMGPKRLLKLFRSVGFNNVHISYIPEVIFCRSFFKSKLGLRILNFYSSRIEKTLEMMGFLIVAIGENP